MSAPSTKSAHPLINFLHDLKAMALLLPYNHLKVKTCFIYDGLEKMGVSKNGGMNVLNPVFWSLMRAYPFYQWCIIYRIEDTNFSTLNLNVNVLH